MRRRMRDWGVLSRATMAAGLMLVLASCGADETPSGSTSGSTGGSGGNPKTEGTVGGGTGSAQTASASQGSGGSTTGASGGTDQSGTGESTGESWGDGQSGAGETTGEGGGAFPGEPNPGGTSGSDDIPGAEPLPPVEENETECNADEATVVYLSADDSNSMAGPAVARALIQRGQRVYKALRTYEFTNYYSFDYAPPASDAIKVSAQMLPHEDGATYSLQIGVRAPNTTAEQRRAVNLTLSIDTSSSMGWGAEGKQGMDRVKESCSAIGSALRSGDVISVVTWADDVNVQLDSHPVNGPSDPVIEAVCKALKPLGVTNFAAGIAQTYALANKNEDTSKNNRVVLFSDGGANVDPTDIELIAQNALDGEDEGIYLIGVGVGDAWNYNDGLLDALTDAGKGAYIFLDDAQEAKAMFGERFVSNVQVAARGVQVEVTLPPALVIETFYGEEISTDPEEVEPQHLAASDAMIFNQTVKSCAGELDPSASLTVLVRYQDPVSFELKKATLETTLGALLEQDQALVLKGDAVVAYAEALADVRDLDGAAALPVLDAARTQVLAALEQLDGDADLAEIDALLDLYMDYFDGTFEGGGVPVPLNPKAIASTCGGCDMGAASELTTMSCALDVCGSGLLLEQSYTSPTGAATTATRMASAHFGDVSNDLAPKAGQSYAVMSTGPAAGTSHSEWVSQQAGVDPYSPEAFSIYDVVEWRIRLRAPQQAGGLGVSYVFFSEEYDDYVGSQFNDKFYIVIEAGSTNGGKPTVINYTECRDPESYFDFICSPGMQFCEPGQKYCYLAVNTAASECCWLGGCPDGTAQTSIAGTGFECAVGSAADGDHSGSSTGWITTTWPIEPGEEFDLIFHLHDTSDGIFDSQVILDQLQFFDTVRAGTVKYGFSM